MTTSTRQHDTADGPRRWVFQTNLRTAAGRLARRPVTAKSHQFGLFWRVFAVNGVILLIAFALLVLTPITVSSPTTTDQLLVLSAGLAVMLVANAALLRFSLTPLRRLADQMGTVDVLDPGERLRAQRHRRGRHRDRGVQRGARPARGGAAVEHAPRAVRTGGGAPADRAGAARPDRAGPDRGRARAEAGADRGSRRRRPRRWPTRRSWRARASRTCGGSATSCARWRSTTSACPARSPRCAPTSPGARGSTSSSTASPGRCRRSTATPSWRSTGSPRSRSPTPSATPAAPASTSRLTPEPAGLVLRVADDGCGFDAAAARRRHPRDARAGAGDRRPPDGGRRAERRRRRHAPPAAGRTEPPVTGDAASPIRVLLADDHAVVRRGLRLVLESAPDLRSSPRWATAPRPSTERRQGRRRPRDPRHLDAPDGRPGGGPGAPRGAAGHEDPDALDARQRAVLPGGAPRSAPAATCSSPRRTTT